MMNPYKRNTFFVPGNNISIKHSCVAHLYFCFLLSFYRSEPQSPGHAQSLSETAKK